MSETPFIITIDAEGDDLWANPREITTRNAEYLPRFQSLCERFRFKPVYLANYEMAMSDVFVEFARDVLARGAGEIGMHLHAWNSPPLDPLTSDDLRFHPYLIEYPEPVMKEKIKTLTRLLEDRFDQKMTSHRAGRWAFDGRYAAMLLDEGYRVDCSVTPGVDWRGNPGDPRGNGGSDYTAFPDRPYFPGPLDISVPGAGELLEVPMTTRWSAKPLIGYRQSSAGYARPRFSKSITSMQCCSWRARRGLTRSPIWNSCCIPRSSCRAGVRPSRTRRISSAYTSTWRCCSRILPPGAEARP